jgi:SAM-dependent methyltransferase
MEPKPRGWSERYGSVFRDRAVVDVYHLRPPYPPATLDLLAELAGGGPVLDAGCGPGELSRGLAPRVARVDAVDVSVPMLERGRALPGGDAPNLRWLHGRIEEVELDPPYALAIAAESVHWFDWEVALPRLRSVLAPDAPFAVVHRDWLRDERVLERLRPVYRRHSWNDDFEPRDPATELERRGLLQKLGEREIAAVPWRPTLDELVEVHFSTSGLARGRVRDPEGFVAAVRAAVSETLEPGDDGRYDLDVAATVVWGRLTL